MKNRLVINIDNVSKSEDFSLCEDKVTIKEELQYLFNTNSSDVDYLLYMLVKDSDDAKVEQEVKVNKFVPLVEIDMETWFDSL